MCPLGHHKHTLTEREPVTDLFPWDYFHKKDLLKMLHGDGCLIEIIKFQMLLLTYKY